MKHRSLQLITAMAVFLFFTIHSCFAQEKPFFASPSVPYDQKMKIFAEDGKHVYIAKFANAKGSVHNDLVIEKKEFLTDKVVFSTVLPDYYTYQQKVRVPSSFFKCVLVNDKVFAFYEYINNDTDTMKVLLQTIDINTGVASRTYNVYSVFTKNNRTESIVEFSSNKEYFMVCADPHSPFISAGPGHFFQIDLSPKLYKTSDVSLVWEKAINKEVSYTSSKYRDFKIDNWANLFALSDEDEVSVLRVFPSGEEGSLHFPDVLPLSKHCKNGTLLANKDGKIVFAGVIADKGKNETGLFDKPAMFIKIVNSSNFSIEQSYEFPIDSKIIGRLSVDKSAKKEWSLKALNDFLAFNIKESTDGYYLTAEHVFMETDNMFANRTFKDIIVVKVSKEGNLKFMKLIPRRNRGGWGKNIVAESFLISDKLVVLYSEEKSHATSEFESLSSATMIESLDYYGNIVLACESDGGNFKKMILFDNKKGGQIFMGWLGICPASAFAGDKVIIPLQDYKANTIRFEAYKVN